MSSWHKLGSFFLVEKASMRHSKRFCWILQKGRILILGSNARDTGLSLLFGGGVWGLHAICMAEAAVVTPALLAAFLWQLCSCMQGSFTVVTSSNFLADTPDCSTGHASLLTTCS